MTTTTTRTQIVSITYSTVTIYAASKTTAAYVCLSIRKEAGGAEPCYSWTNVTFVAEPERTTIAAGVSPIYTTETITRVDEWISSPESITIMFSTKTRATITAPVTINAKALEFWDPGASCFIWFRVLNATNGSRLAEAGVRAAAGTAP